MTLNQFRRVAYRSARVAGDVNALASGDPKRIAKRVVNKGLGRLLGQLFLR